MTETLEKTLEKVSEEVNESKEKWQEENQILREMLLDEMNKKVQAGKKAKRIIEELRGEKE